MVIRTLLLVQVVAMFTLPIAVAETANSLAGTSWQLVRINSINDTQFVPASGANYILRFRAEDRLVAESDCNSAGATWVQENGLLRFEQFVTTNKFCQPGSLHNRFVSSLLSVNSFDLIDGKLILNTVVEGVSIELEAL